ncbi:MAG: beta-galactosidase trimerization domain-containing protein, partial [Candidatus Latescibacteria bacterium]|nr:beta-galactosidase trimerization domain-containing protein [Candidatus Latescibacterota bacterium]
SAYRLVWLPYHLMLTEEQAGICLDYVNRGGILVSEPCLGFRAPNTWVRTGNIPACRMDRVFGAREIHRTKEKQERLISFPDWSLSEVRFRRYTVELEVLDGNPVGVFGNSNMPFAVEKIHGKGRTLLLGGFVGLSSPGAMKKFLITLLEKEGLAVSNVFLVFDENNELLKENNYNVRWRRHITSDGRALLFIFNYDTKPRTLRWACPPIGACTDIITQTKIVDGALTLNPKQTMCIVLH